MHLREGEYVIIRIRRHLTPFVFMLLKIILVSLPFYIIVFFIGNQLGIKFQVYAYLFISLFLGFFIIFVGIIYILDQLVLTNKRMVFINWHSLWRKDEVEAELSEIQDIRTREKGFLAKFRIFDYGLVEIETASSNTTLRFEDAPDPEGTKIKILSIIRKGHL